MSETAPWRVLVLCAGRSTELVRPELVGELKRLGFDANVYDNPGYPADPSLDNVSACVEAIDQHDIVVALIDEEEGSEIEAERLDPGIREYLLEQGLLPEAGSGEQSPTILQLEIGVARTRGKPTLVLVSKEARDSQREVREMLEAGELELRAKRRGVPDAAELIAAGDLKQLAADYEVPSGRLASFRHLLFISSLEASEDSTWLRFYGRSNLEEVKSKTLDALAQVPLALTRRAFGPARSRLERARTPLGAPSLQDLLSDNLILAPPYRLRSGDGEGALYSPPGGGGLLRERLLEGRSVLLLGDPGLGKSTLTMLVYASLEGAATSVPQRGVLWASWRDLGKASDDWEATLRRLLGLSDQRGPWPQALALPRLKWILLLDGLDESPLGTEQAAEVMGALSEHATLLVSCRRSDYRRYLEGQGASFAVIVELTPWDEGRLKAYAAALQAADRSRAAQAVRSLVALRRGPEMISYPLWLSMLTYLVEHEIDVEVGQLDDYGLLRRTMSAVAKEEAKRQRIASENKAVEVAWGQSAWLLHQRRRDGLERLTVAELAEQLEMDTEQPLFKATCSLLDIGDETVKGFRHEVLHDYWLGEYIAARLPEADTEEITGLLGRQRSAVANDAVRGRLRLNGRATESAESLRAHLDQVADDPRSAFVKNQMLYFLGRLGEEADTREFLARLWRSDESDFVRYSAAFTGVMIGADGVEEEYYERLVGDEDSDALNRGYHLFYHGDLDVAETEMPYLDNDFSVAAQRSMEVLIERLGLKRPENLRLRRIELLTLRRFVETRGAPKGEALAALDDALAGIQEEHVEEGRRSSIKAEIAMLQRVAGLEEPPDAEEA